MDFSLTEEQKMWQTQMRDFSIKELEPVAAQLDEAEEFGMDNFKKMAGLGLTGLLIPTEYGGSGGDTIMLVIALEEMSRVCASTADILDAHLCLCARPILLNGNEEQKKKFLPPLAKGEKIGAFAITESEAGSDVGAAQTRAVKDGNSYVVNGSKIFITNGNVADTVVLFASTDPAAGGRGLTTFIIEKGMPGFSVGKKFLKLGMHAATNAELVFQDCQVPEANRLGDEGRGMRICLTTLDEGRIGIAAQALGMAQGVLDLSIPYVKQRVQFGRPIAENQAIQWMIADIGVRVEAARLLTYRAAYLYDAGARVTKEAAMAKLFASETAMWATTKGIQMHGGYGYMMDHPIQRFFRDAKLTEIYEGTSEVQRMVISRALLT